MAVTQVLNALGTFEFELLGTVPRDVLDTIQYFGHIAIIPGRVDMRQYGDGVLPSARYVGVVRRKKVADDGRTNLIEDDIRIGGVGMEFWLGDDDGKGAVIENLTTFSSAGFATVMSASPTGLRPPSVGAGTIYSVSGSYSGQHQYETPRSAISYVCQTMSTTAVPVGYRVNNNATLDAGPESNLYVTNPNCTIVFKGVTQGEDMFQRALPSTVDYDEDMEDFATRVVMLAEADSQSLATGSADIATIAPGVNVYKDMFGNALALTKLVSESDTTVPLANTRAQIALRAVIDKNRSLTLSADDYDFHGSFQPGDYVYVYDPDAGLVDTANETMIRGVRINPIKLQVTEADWSITEGYTVAYRDANGAWTDLTDYIHWDESTPVKVVVGDFARTLSSTGEDVGARLSALIPADLLFPAAPTWNAATGASYNDTNGYPKARVLLSWNTPNNTDGTTITDGQFYDLQFRLQGQTAWDSRSVVWGQNTLLLQDLAVGTGYEARIRGVDTGGNTGAFSSTLTFTTSTDSVAPATPAAPTVATSTLAVQVTHNLGLNSGGSFNLDQDLAYLEVHQGSTSGFTASASTLIGTMLANKGMMTATSPAVMTFDISQVSQQWFKVVGVDTSGNKSYSNASPAASSTATLVDTSHISDLIVSKVTAGTISANWTVGAKIGTAFSGARVELNTTGFQAFDSGGNNTVNITNAGQFSITSPPSAAATPVISQVGTSVVWNTSVSATSFQINRPPGVQVGDFMLAFVATNASSSATASLSGWTQIGTTGYSNVATTNGDTNLLVFKRDYALDDPAYWTGTTTTATTMQTVVQAYRGADAAANQFSAGNFLATTSTSGGTTRIAGPVTNGTTNSWRVVAFAGTDSTSGGAWSSSQTGDVEYSDTEAGTGSIFGTLAIYDSNGSVANTSQSATGTFPNNFLSAVGWLGYIHPRPQANSSSRIEIDQAGIRAYNQVNTKTLDITAATGSIDLQGSVESFNYLENSEGWRIDGNGSAQFENINVTSSIGAEVGAFDTSLTYGGINVATESFFDFDFPALRVAMEVSATISPTANTDTRLDWDTKYYERNVNTGDMWTAGSPSRLVAHYAGIYHLDFNVGSRWTAGQPAGITTSIASARLNAGGVATSGTEVCRGIFTLPASSGAGSWYYSRGSTDVAMAAGDYIEIFEHVNATGTTRLMNISVSETYANLRWVSSLNGIGTGGTNSGHASFPIIGCRTFNEDNSERSPFIGDWAYQGYYDGLHGNQKSILSFDYTAIAAALSGKTVTRCTLTYHVAHSYYSTLDMVFGTHNSTASTASIAWPPTGLNSGRIITTNRAEGVTYIQDLGTTIGNEFQAGTAKGIVFGPGPAAVQNYYGYIYGYQTDVPWYMPTLTFTYS